MSENRVKKAFDGIEPETGAQERMYSNILKKAAAEKSGGKDAQVVPMPSRRSVPLWRRYGAVAACLVLAAAVGILYPHFSGKGETDDPPVMVGSPFEDVAGPQDFERLGFVIDAPEGAENLYYCIFDGEIARVDFTLNGHDYSYEAARLDGNFSRVQDEAVDSSSLNAECGAVLDRVSSGAWRAHWTSGGVSCYLTNFDGAGEADITAAANALMEQG